MKKILLAVLSLVLLVGARPLTEVADDVVKAKNDINAAILARGGNGIGGLTNAAQRIIDIPLPQLEFEQTYIAWSNATRTVSYAVTNDTYYLVEWLHPTKDNDNSILLTDIYANQDTCVEVAVSNMNASAVNLIFGSRSNNNARFGIHTYNSKISFPYYNSWNDNKAPATTGLMVLKIDGNKCYVNGELVFTATRQEFITSTPLVVFNQNGNNNTAYRMEGSILYMNIYGAVNSENQLLPDIRLVPAVRDWHDRASLIDLNSQNTYIANTIISSSAPTNTFYDISYIQFQAQCPEPYETNIVGEVQNKLLINDAMRYLYEKMSQGK